MSKPTLIARHARQQLVYGEPDRLGSKGPRWLLGTCATRSRQARATTSPADSVSGCLTESSTIRNRLARQCGDSAAVDP